MDLLDETLELLVFRLSVPGFAEGFEAGLVDFYSLREDRPIFLCWRLGEDRITHWHEVDSGFSGRQPIDGAILSATTS